MARRKRRSEYRGTVATAKGKQSVKEAYRKEVRRIQQFIRRAVRRGYRFAQDILPAVPKRITEASVRRLQRLGAEALYKKSTALSEDGQIVSGLERRKEERSEVSRKSARTLRRKREAERLARERAEIQKLEEKYDLKNRPAGPAEFQSWIRDRDEFHRKRLRMQEYRDMFNEGDLILSRIYSMIDQVEKQNKKSAEVLRQVLEEEIQNYGKEAVTASIAQAPAELVEACEVAIMYRPETGQHQEAIREILHLIRGSIPTAYELKQLQEAMDSDDYEDFA